MATLWIERRQRAKLETKSINTMSGSETKIVNRHGIGTYSGQNWVVTEDAFLKGLERKHEYTDQLLINNQLINLEKSETPRPHILILSSGEMTVFQWDINDENNHLNMRLQSSLLGRIVMEGPSGTLL